MRDELRKALKAKEALESEVERLNKSMGGIQVHLEAEKEARRLDNRREVDRHTKEIRRVEQRFLAIQTR